MHQNIFKNYFIIFFSLIPLSILVGPTISLANILLICLPGLITLFIIYRQGLNFFLSYPVKLILILYIYLIFNSFIALDFQMSAVRNFGFLRFIILFILCNYFFYISDKSNNIFKFWLVILLLVIFDVFYESINGKNILGYGGDVYGKRIVSFFKTEPVAGFYIYSFFLLILGYLFVEYKNHSNYKKNLILLFSLLAFAAILITGERSNTIKCFIGLILFYFVNSNFSLKKKISFLLLTVFLFLISVNYVPFLKTRYKHQIYNIFAQEHQRNKITSNLYYNLYLSAFKVFKNHPLFGVGNKNYRVETCERGHTFEFGTKDETKNKFNYLCVTHPHQVYFEFLSEHGLIGTTILLFIFFSLIFKNLKIIILSQNYIQIGCFIYLLINFLPLLPGGSFFSDFKSTFFWLNLSIMYAVNKDTNIFYLMYKNHNFTNHK